MHGTSPPPSPIRLYIVYSNNNGDDDDNDNFKGFWTVNEFLLWGIRVSIIFHEITQIAVGTKCPQEVGRREIRDTVTEKGVDG
jgi:hypothetical protein